MLAERPTTLRKGASRFEHCFLIIRERQALSPKRKKAERQEK